MQLPYPGSLFNLPGITLLPRLIRSSCLASGSQLQGSAGWCICQHGQLMSASILPSIPEYSMYFVFCLLYLYLYLCLYLYPYLYLALCTKCT